MRVARKWIAGTTVREAIAESKRINADGAMVMVNYLGEHITDRTEVARALGVYKDLIISMHKRRIKGSIAVKPTQLGLCIRKALFYSSYSKIAGLAASNGIFVWLDMEEYEYVDQTIDAYLHLLKSRKNIGICIQAKLRRSLKDAERVARAGGSIRLVKGAYTYRHGESYHDMKGINKNYTDIIDLMAKKRVRFIAATHDKKMVDYALAHGNRAGMSFAMLKGVRWKLASSLIKEGNTVSIYVPFGEDWMKYSIRRLRELRTAMLIARSMMQG